MTFSRTFDYALLNALVRNPSLYPFLGDDFAPPLEDAVVAEDPRIWYILGQDGGGILGFWIFEPRTTILFEFHTVMPLNSRALAALRDLLGDGGWLWANTPCLRAETYVPAGNPIAQRFGLRAGLKVFGRDPDSYMKGGVIEDRILMGASKPKEITCQS